MLAVGPMTPIAVSNGRTSAAARHLVNLRPMRTTGLAAACCKPRGGSSNGDGAPRNRCTCIPSAACRLNGCLRHDREISSLEECLGTTLVALKFAFTSSSNSNFQRDI